MAKPKIAIFSGPNATIANSPPLVTSNKARKPGERRLDGRYDNLVPQLLYESVKVKIKKYSAHPLEIDSKEVYQDDGLDYFEVTLSPEDGPYLLPYMARRKDGSEKGAPFEAMDMWNPSLGFGGRQFFYPDASRVFDEIDRTTAGRGPDGEGNALDKRADYDFVRVLPPGGYRSKGELAGIHYFPYRPEPIMKIIRAGDLATAANIVQDALKKGNYTGGIWLDGSPQLEEAIYWLNLLVDTELPLAGVAAQRPHGEVSADGDRNLIDAVDYVISEMGKDLGAVGVSDQVIYASREFKKADARPGNYKVTGGHGGILGSVKDGVTIWYRPAYKHTHKSDVNLSKLPSEIKFPDGTATKTKDECGWLIPSAVPRVRIVKYASYSQEDESDDPRQELDIMAWTEMAIKDHSAKGNDHKLHGLVFEGLSPYAVGGPATYRALSFAAASGLPVVRTGRSDPGGKVNVDPNDLTIEGSNLDSTKARLLLIASMLKLGRLPKAQDPFNPTMDERKAIVEKVAQFQAIFDSH
jgi:L-asparaginase